MATEILLPARPVSSRPQDRCLAEARSVAAQPAANRSARVLHFPFEPEPSSCIRGLMVAIGFQWILVSAALLAWEIWRLIR